MKRMLVVLLCAAVTGLHASQLEEARRIIREAVEERGHSRTPVRELCMLGLTALERDVIMSECCEFLSERFDNLDPEQLYPIMSAFYYLDGMDMASYGNQEALDWTRRITRMLKEQGREYAANGYLFAKGDARDLDIIGGGRFEDMLTTRVAGTNMFRPLGDLHWQGCTPSVTNTGPQALYVEAILRQCWENLKVESHFGNYGTVRQFRDRSKIPEELLTLVVWFDDDGNPVCNVDLAKYGLTMPVIEPKPTVMDSLGLKRTVTFPPLGETPPQKETGVTKPLVDTLQNATPISEQPQATPKNKNPLRLGILALAVISAVTAWRLAKRKR